MRKFVVLFMIMAIITGMSLSVMAESVDVNVTIGTFAQVDIEDNTLNLTLDEPGNKVRMGEEMSSSTTVTLKTNGAVKVEVQENISKEVAQAIKAAGYSPDLVWAQDDYNWVNGEQYDGRQRFVAAFEAHLSDVSGVNMPSTWKRTPLGSGYYGVVTEYNYNQGKYEEQLTLRGTWAGFDAGYQDDETLGEIDESKITQLYDWWKVPANNYSGEVTVTVSAQ